MRDFSDLSRKMKVETLTMRDDASKAPGGFLRLLWTECEGRCKVRRLLVKCFEISTTWSKLSRGVRSLVSRTTRGT
jgi:hypothetical protein